MGEMEIRADTHKKDKIPKLGDVFVVTKVENIYSWWKIVLNKIDIEGLEKLKE